MLNWQNKPFIKIISVILAQAFLLTSAAYPEPPRKSSYKQYSNNSLKISYIRDISSIYISGLLARTTCEPDRKLRVPIGSSNKRMLEALSISTSQKQGMDEAAFTNKVDSAVNVISSIDMAPLFNLLDETLNTKVGRRIDYLNRYLKLCELVANAIRNGAERNFDYVIYPASGLGDTMKALSYLKESQNPRIVTIDRNDIFKDIDDINRATVSKAVIENFSQRLTQGFVVTSGDYSEGFIDYLISLVIFGADLKSLKVIKNEKIGLMTVTELEFKIGEKSYTHTHFTYEIGGSLDPAKEENIFIKNYLEGLKGSGVVVNTAGSQKGEKIKDYNRIQFLIGTVPFGTIIVSDNENFEPVAKKIWGNKKDLKPVDIEEDLKKIPDEIDFYGPDLLGYGYVSVKNFLGPNERKLHVIEICEQPQLISKKENQADELINFMKTNDIEISDAIKQIKYYLREYSLKADHWNADVNSNSPQVADFFKKEQMSDKNDQAQILRWALADLSRDTKGIHGSGVKGHIVFPSLYEKRESLLKTIKEKKGNAYSDMARTALTNSIHGLALKQMRTIKKEKIKLSDLSRYFKNIHNLNLENVTEKLSKIITHVRNGGRITDEFLESIAIEKDEQIYIVETQEPGKDKELNILQGNHRLASLLTLYNLGFIDDIEISVFLSKGDEEDVETLSFVKELYSLIGIKSKGIEADKLRILALRLIKDSKDDKLKFIELPGMGLDQILDAAKSMQTQI